MDNKFLFFSKNAMLCNCGVVKLINKKKNIAKHYITNTTTL